MGDALNNRSMASRNRSSARALAHESRVTLLHALQQSDRALGAHELATALGLHRTTVREHLEHLAQAGYVAKSAEARTTRGRPRILYSSLDQPAIPPADVWFRENLIKILLAGYGRPVPDRALTAAAEGQERAADWVSPRAAAPIRPEGPSGVGGELHQLAVLEAHLEELGFEPDVDRSAAQIHLYKCPFLDLAREHTDVVCSVHLGLARGILAQCAGPLSAARLEPFVEPEHCILHLQRDRESAPL